MKVWVRSQTSNSTALIAAMKVDLPNEEDFELSVDLIVEIMVKMLSQEDREVWTRSKDCKGKQGKTTEELALMKARKTIQNKLYRWVKALKNRMDYPVDDASDTCEVINKKARQQYLYQCNKLTATYFDAMVDAGVPISKISFKDPFERDGADINYSNPFTIAHNLDYPPTTSFLAFKWWLIWQKSDGFTERMLFPDDIADA